MSQQPPAGSDPATNPPAEGGGAQQPPSQAQNDGNAALARKLKKQLTSTEAELAGYRQREADAKKAEMTEVERFKLETGEWKTKYEQLEQQRVKDRVSADFRLAAVQAGCKDPEAAALLADLTGCQLEGDKVSGVTEALAAVQQARAYLFGDPAPPAALGSGGGNPGKAPGSGFNSYTPEQLRTMPAEEFRKVYAAAHASPGSFK